MSFSKIFCSSGPLESKGMRANFQKRGNKMLKRDKIFENLAKNEQYLKIFWKRACDCLRLLQAMYC